MLQNKYFVLNPLNADEYGRASRLALATYATQIEAVDPELANGIDNWLAEISLQLLNDATKLARRERRGEDLIQELAHPGRTQIPLDSIPIEFEEHALAGWEAAKKAGEGD